VPVIFPAVDGDCILLFRELLPQAFDLKPN
jgi:hypothetical protein